ncbi:hypothetical protein AU361_13390 [Klebsiella pneumoniae]|nr:hypothetical protein AU361_13390 [Klebsiella pneumoniae]
MVHLNNQMHQNHNRHQYLQVYLLPELPRQPQEGYLLHVTPLHNLLIQQLQAQNQHQMYLRYSTQRGCLSSY